MKALGEASSTHQEGSKHSGVALVPPYRAGAYLAIAYHLFSLVVGGTHS